MRKQAAAVTRLRLFTLLLLGVSFFVFLIGGFWGGGDKPALSAPAIPWSWGAFSQARLKPGKQPGQWRWPGVGRVRLHTGWQAHAEKTIGRFTPPYAAVLVQEVETGHLLAAAATGGGQWAGFRGQAFQHPLLGHNLVAASIMKVPTAAALLEKNVATIHTVSRCTGAFNVGGGSVSNYAWRDYGPLSLARALAKSCNSIFARYGQQVRWAPVRGVIQRLGWADRAFGLPATATPVAPAKLEGLALSEATAGFGHVLVTPWHMLQLATTVANHGQPNPPRWLDLPPGWEPKGGEKSCAAACRFTPSAALSPKVADQLALALREGVHDPIGTAHKGFFSPGGRFRLPETYDVFAKTGSLNNPDPKGYLTWFVGGVKRPGKPTLAVVSMVINDPVWRIRAAGLAGELLAGYPDL